MASFPFDITATLAAGSYDLCWDESSSSKIGSVPAITVEAATPPAATTTFDVCWDDGPATSATEYQGEYR
jgi:hypothetical protein